MCAPQALAKSARARHFQVEEDRVDANRLERVDRVFGGSGDGGQLETVVALDDSRQYRASDHRIVDDHQPDTAISGLRSRLAIPRSGERPLHGRTLKRRRRAEA